MCVPQVRRSLDHRPHSKLSLFLQLFLGPPVDSTCMPHAVNIINTSTKWSDAQPLVEREKQFERGCMTFPDFYSLPRTRNINYNIQNIQHFFTFLAPRNLNPTTLELVFLLNQRISI